MDDRGSSFPSQDRSGSGGSIGSVVFVSAAIFAATALPLLLYLRRCFPFAEASVFQPDAFYYLTIARNSLHTRFYSFDGVHPTNGFHPVWEFLLCRAMRVNLLRPEDPFVTLHRLYVGSLLILSTGWALLAAFCARHLRRPWLAFAAVCPGFLWFPVALTAPKYLSNWSYLNGMENCVELLFMGLALISFSKERLAPYRLALSMFFFGMMVLSRLDDVFFLLPVLVLVWKTQGKFRHRGTVVALAVPVAMLAAYFVYNRVYVGVFLPTSGALKAGLSLGDNLRGALAMVVPGHWSQMSVGDSGFAELYMRVFQILAPMLVCCVFLIRRDRAPWGLIEALCVGVLLKGAYNLVNVRLFHQGSWYFASSIFIGNLVIALLWDRTLSRARPLRVRDSVVHGWGGVMVCGLVASVCFNLYANRLMADGGGRWQEGILVQRDAVRAMVQQAGSDRFIEMNDGELAYATGMQTISGQGLVLDPPAAVALTHGHFFDLAADRDYHLMMASGMYKDQIDAFLKNRKAGDSTPLYTISGEEFDRFRVTSVAYDPGSDTRLYSLQRNF